MNLTRTTTAPRCFDELERPIESESKPFFVVESDPWGRDYRIERESNGQFRVCSDGPDRKPNTADDVGWPAKSDESPQREGAAR